MYNEPYPDTEIVKTMKTPLVCLLCKCPVKADDEDEVLLLVRPAYLRKSKKSGRFRVEELEFNLKRPDLEGHEYLVWHFKCAADELLDPSVIGYEY